LELTIFFLEKQKNNVDLYVFTFFEGKINYRIA
jgi:hypothetical protein